MPVLDYKWGTDFVINANTFAQSIAALPNGDLIAAFGDSSVPSTQKYDVIRGQFVRGDGVPQPDTFKINSAKHVWLQDSDIAVRDDGVFMVSYTEGYMGWNIRARVFSAEGDPVAKGVAVTSPGSTWDPSIVVSGKGRFALFGTSYPAGATVPPGVEDDGDGIGGWVLNKHGAVVQDLFTVNTTTTASQFEPDSASLPSGAYITVWRDQSAEIWGGGNVSLALQHFAANGAKAGSEITMPPVAGVFRYQPQVTGLDGDAYALAWQERTQTGPDTSTEIWRMAVYNSADNEVAAPFDIPDTTDATSLDMLTLADGRIFVAFLDSDGGPHIRGGVFGADGTASTGPFEISTGAVDPDADPLLALMPDGRVAVAWDDGAGQLKAQFIDVREEGLLLRGTADNDTLVGTAFRDRILLGGSGDRAYGGDAFDVIKGNGGKDVLFGEGGNDKLSGGDGDDRLFGGDGDDALDGGRGKDRLFGGDGDDELVGYAGKDRLIGGPGRDGLYGGPGVDKFIFQEVEDSLRNAPDIIKGLGRHERVDLSAIDANPDVDGNQSFDWLGKKGFTGDPGELRYVARGRLGIVTADVDGDGVADMKILIGGVTHLDAGDFIL